MKLQAAWVSLRQHHLEVSVAALAAMAAAILGLSIAVRIAGLGITDDCLDRVRALQDGSLAGAHCFALVRAGSGILGETYFTGEGTIALSIMGALPFLLGLLGGVPIVGRELEARTAQTAWWLNPSRSRWLLRQVVPVAAVLGTLMILAAIVASIVADDWARWYGGRAYLIGTEGIVAVIRAFAAFGIGLALGALLGRTLPAFIFGLALSIAILFALGQAQRAWQASLPATPLNRLDPATGELTPAVGTTTGWGWIAPDGRVLSQEGARQIAADAGVAPPEPGDVQDTPAGIWLQEHGYHGVQMGVTDETAMGWATYDAAAFGGVGLIALGGAFFLVNRRRPLC